MKNNKSHFLVGLIAILPFVLLFKLFASVPGWILDPLKEWLPDLLAELLGLAILLGAIWLIGLFINQGKIGIALKKWVISVVKKIPVIGPIFKTVGQVIQTVKYTDSFKGVVLVEFPVKGKWAPAYMVQEYEGYLALHLPSSPSAWTAPQLLIMKEKDVIRTNIKPQSLFSSVLTLGTSEAMLEIIKEVEKVNAEAEKKDEEN